MIATSSTPSRAKWEVLWIAKGRIIRKDFQDDLASAQELFVKVKLAGRKGATLRCKNMGFAPPEHLRPQHVRKKKRNARGKVVVVEGIIRPMRKLNLAGIIWCPYCMRLRRFEAKNGFKIAGVYVHEFGHHCPMCGVSQRDNNVQKYNPLMPKIAMEIAMRGNRRVKPRQRKRRARS